MTLFSSVTMYDVNVKAGFVATLLDHNNTLKSCPVNIQYIFC